MYSQGYFEGACSTGYPTYLADSRLLLENFGERVDWIESRRPPGRRLLEVGCAYGFFLAAARDRGFDVTGVEISEACAEAATRMWGVNVVRGDFMQQPLEGHYDVIAMFDVIEHMRDPAAVIRRARELLAPGGLLVMETGDLAAPWARALGSLWYFLDPPQHLFYFSAVGLERLVRSSGFTGDSSLRRMGRRVSTSNIGFKLSAGLPNGRFRRSLATLSRKKLPGYLYLNFGDAMMLSVATHKTHGARE